MKKTSFFYFKVLKFNQMFSRKNENDKSKIYQKKYAFIEVFVYTQSITQELFAIDFKTIQTFLDLQK